MKKRKNMCLAYPPLDKWKRMESNEDEREREREKAIPDNRERYEETPKI
jgi:hypothetical protein